jgi:hypothetical protein
MVSPARSRWILVTLLLATISLVWWAKNKPAEHPTAYVADRTVTVWNTTAQVRRPVATLEYGERVAVLRESGERVQVRTRDGNEGWLEAGLLMDERAWQEAADLVVRAKGMPVQAEGHTGTISNVRAAPGREAPRVAQLGRDVPVVVLARSTVPAPLPTGSAVSRAADDQETRREDWLLVLVRSATDQQDSAEQSGAEDLPVFSARRSGPVPVVAGWVLGRFITLTPPPPIPEYASAAGMRVVAWAVLNTVPDSSSEKPQYFVAGTRGSEGQLCDFVQIRVYTWNPGRDRYETAYIESGLCGQMPIAVQRTADGAEFHFSEALSPGESRIYRLRQTIVRRIRQRDSQPSNQVRH